MALMKIFNAISLKVLAIAPQKLVSQMLLLYKSLYNYVDKLIFL